MLQIIGFMPEGVLEWVIFSRLRHALRAAIDIVDQCTELIGHASPPGTCLTWHTTDESLQEELTLLAAAIQRLNDPWKAAQEVFADLH